MIRGESVFVEPITRNGSDALRNPISVTGEPYEVKNVLVAPGSSQDLSETIRPDGNKVTYTLHFPKGFNESLRGLRIKVRGEWTVVVGDPQRYTEENVPGAWSMPVEVVRVDG